MSLKFPVCEIIFCFLTPAVRYYFKCLSHLFDCVDLQHRNALFSSSSTFSTVRDPVWMSLFVTEHLSSWGLLHIFAGDLETWKRTCFIPSHGSFLNLCRLKTIKLPLNEDGIISMHSAVWLWVSSTDQHFQWRTFLFYCVLGILNLRDQSLC